MNPGFFEALLGRVATGIGDLARGLKGRLSRWLRGRRRAKNPEIAEQLRSFDRPYLELLSHALKDVTGQEIDPGDLRRMSIGDVSLSQRLYRQHVATAARVRQILAEHTKYAHDSRKLALDLYEGYGFREREVLMPKVRLPKYLEQARLNREMDALLARIQAAKLKTPALRAGYLQMLDAILGDAGQEAIDNALNVAVQERYRYFANRIAQTELARAQTDEVARELMADETVQVVRHRLSGGHVPDLCDVFTRADRYGLGPGLYPKALAPKPPHHPHCRCTLSAELFRSAAGARYDPAADAAYLRTLDPKTAARVAGSRAKRDEILQGANAEALWNKGRPEAYRIGRVGDSVSKAPTLDDFWHGRTGQAEHPIARLSAADMALIGAKSPTVMLSRLSLDEHLAKHPEIGLSDYRKIPEIIAHGQVWSVPGKSERIVFMQIGDVIYRAAVKRTADGEKNYLLTLFRNTKNKPPKGSVRLR